MLLKKKSLIITSLLLTSVAFADDSSLNTTDSYLESVNFNNYITSKSYPKITIDNGYGQLVTESQIGVYKADALQEFYKEQICAGLWGRDCKFNINSLQQYTGIDLNVESSLVGQEFSQINAYKVVYTTKGMDGLPHNVSGAVLIPQSDQPLKGVVIFYHFTVLNKMNVPSNFTGDEFKISKMLAATVASAGYVVLMPDYLGEGIDQNAQHPYMIYPDVNALSGLYMLKLIPQLQPALRYQLSDEQIPLYLSGYSEGSGYSLWAAKILQDNKSYLDQYGYKLTKTVPIDGAYNLSNVVLPFLLGNVEMPKVAPYFIQDPRITSFSKPGLAANVLNSYSNFSLNNNESAVFTSAFSACYDCTDGNQATNVAGLLQSQVNEFNKYKMLYNAAKEAGYSNDNNSLATIINPQLLLSTPFKNAVENADIYNWHSLSPISFLTLENDSVVPRLNAETAYAAMAENGSSSLNITVVPNQNFKVNSYIPFSDDDVDHTDGYKFLLLFARNQFNESAPSVTNATNN